MAIIYKYKIPVQLELDIVLPKGSKILSVQEQNSELQLWALIDETEKKTEMVKLHIIGTGGKNIPEGIEYINTVQMGALVWHIFKAAKDDQ